MGYLIGQIMTRKKRFRKNSCGKFDARGGGQSCRKMHLRKKFEIPGFSRYCAHLLRNKNLIIVVKIRTLYDKYFLSYCNCENFNVFQKKKILKISTVFAITRKVFVVERSNFYHNDRIFIQQKMSTIS